MPDRWFNSRGPRIAPILGSANARNLTLQKAKRRCPPARRLRAYPRYSAAWKVLGKALHESGALTEAREAYREGIAAAEARGDIQAAKEMTVFARRIDKQLAGG